jgi:hypothetical protein
MEGSTIVIAGVLDVIFSILSLLFSILLFFGKLEEKKHFEVSKRGGNEILKSK